MNNTFFCIGCIYGLNKLLILPTIFCILGFIYKQSIMADKILTQEMKRHDVISVIMIQLFANLIIRILIIAAFL